ncbi:uncharacterized protein LOC112639639 [Camponotus floridanus]|uniref:uncharacterized protein LOC112639639 n=1 Tax=Camponotus floridanus TaxID=104421 RepID=UPI000DC6CB0A|nr:uncharacterized protein LOC112639639 [Camponotus floridanus]
MADRLLPDLRPPVQLLSGLRPPVQLLSDLRPPVQLLSGLRPPVQLLSGLRPPVQLLSDLRPPVQLLSGLRPPVRLLPDLRPPVQLLPGLRPPAPRLPDLQPDSATSTGTTGHPEPSEIPRMNPLQEQCDEYIRPCNRVRINSHHGPTRDRRTLRSHKLKLGVRDKRAYYHADHDAINACQAASSGPEPGTIPTTAAARDIHPAVRPGKPEGNHPDDAAGDQATPPRKNRRSSRPPVGYQPSTSCQEHHDFGSQATDHRSAHLHQGS